MPDVGPAGRNRGEHQPRRRDVGTIVGGGLFFERGGDRTLGDHAGGENGATLLVPEGRLGDRYMHGVSSSDKQMVYFFCVS